jgi:hypothetical protein
MNANSNAWPIFAEYNTRDTEGTLLTPASNVVTFVDPGNASLTKEAETVLTAEQTADYSIENTLGAWAADAQAAAKQVVGPASVTLTGTNLTWDAIGGVEAYLVEKKTADGVVFVAITTATTIVVEDAEAEYIVRAANSRGGFGQAKDISLGVEEVKSENTLGAEKRIVNGQLMIIKDGKIYNTMGVMIR